MPEPDLAGNADQADDTERPRRDGGAEADLEQIFGLVDLHRVPDVEAAEIAERDPPEARGAQRAAQRPVGPGPDRVDDVRARCGRFRRRRGVAVGPQADIFGALAQQQIDRRQHHEHQMPIAVQAVRQPDCSIMCCTHGSSVTEPMPTPAKASPMARPRRRTNQFGRNSDWPE